MTHDLWTAFPNHSPGRDTTTRQHIPIKGTNRTIEIVVVKRGKNMGKRGPKRKEGYLREADGRLDRRTTAQRINDANLRDIREEQSVVLAQPHRRGSDNRLCSSALGRFCLRAGCSYETYSGVEAYAITHQRWLIAIGKPPGYDKIVSIGSGDGPTPDQIFRWRARLDEIECALVRQFPGPIIGLVMRLAVDDVDLTESQYALYHTKVRTAFGEIGICTGFLEKNPHPF